MAANEYVLGSDKAIIVRKDQVFQPAFLHSDVVEAVNFFDLAAQRIQLQDIERAKELVRLIFNPDGVGAVVAAVEVGMNEVEGLVELDLEVQR